MWRVPALRQDVAWHGPTVQCKSQYHGAGHIPAVQVNLFRAVQCAAQGKVLQSRSQSCKPRQIIQIQGTFRKSAARAHSQQYKGHLQSI